MYCACTPILMGVAIPVSKILLLSKTVKFPFPTMDYRQRDREREREVHGHQKFNHLESAQKFMQVEVNVLCMHTNFDGCRHSSLNETGRF